jgi:hypothetical protein
MTMLIIMVPLMVLAVAIAAVPLLVLSVRENNLVQYGSAKKPKAVKVVYPTRRAGPPPRS